jgi:cytochrome c5
MKSIKIFAMIAIVMLIASAVIAMDKTPEERGKALFNDTTLGGGTSGKSCGTCHADGKGLEGIGSKTEWKGFKSLEEAVNMCITMALKGTALDVKSEQMKDLVSYMKTIKPKEDKAAKKQRPKMGC